MADYNKGNLPDDVWEAARVIWENTPDISYRQLIEQLKSIFGDHAPTSTGSISNRKKKEGWTKKRINKTGRSIAKQNTKHSSEQSEQSDAKNNKGDTSHTIEVFRTAEQKIEHEAQKLVMSAEDRAKIIIKHRRRLRQLGEFQDQTVETAQLLNDCNFDDPEDGERIQRIIIVTETLSRTLAQLTQAQKVIAEQEMPMCGITAEDFSQSEQERRLQGLEALAGIHEEEEQMRAIKRQELLDRMSMITQMEHDPDFFSTNEDAEDVMFSEVEDD